MGLSGTSWHMGGDVSHMHTWRGCGGEAAPTLPGGLQAPVLPRPISGFGVRFLSVHKCLYQSPCVVSKTPGPQPPPLAPDSEQTVRSRRLDTPSRSRRPAPEWEQGVTTTKRQTVFCSLEPSRQRLKGIGPAPAERGVRGPQPHRGRRGQPACLCRSAGLVRRQTCYIHSGAVCDLGTAPHVHENRSRGRTRADNEREPFKTR